jgi:hypothetical protein
MSDDSKFPVKVDIGAKATLEVKAEVPKESAGRFVDAITDIIRPWSEGRGLKGDLIRLQQEEVAYIIARRAAERIAHEHESIKPIPLKTIVPLLEHASQESLDDNFMIDQWAALLASAATSNAVSPRFISLLAEMNSRQAALLLTLNAHPPFDRPDFNARCSKIFATDKAILTGKPSSDQVMLIADIFGPGFLLADTVLHSDRNPAEPTRYVFFTAEPERSIDLEILQSLGLVRFDQREVSIGIDVWITAQYAEVTMLGKELLLLTRAKS